MPTNLSALRDGLRRLAGREASPLPVISAYLNLRPRDNPQVRSGLVVLRDSVRGVERSLGAHTPEYESLTADAERIERFVQDEALPEAHAVAVFASGGADLFETFVTSEPVNDDVTISELPRLAPLARLAAREPAVVALADTNTLRIFVARSGALDEIGLVDDDPDGYGKRQPGGWSQSRFQRRVDEQRDAFAAIAADAIDQVVELEGARHVIIAADDVAAPLLRDALPRRSADLVRDLLRIDIRATGRDVEAVALPALLRLEDEAARDAADRLVGAVLGDGMGIGGLDATREALGMGQGLELIIDTAAGHDDAAIEELVRTAATTDTRVRFVEGHDGLRDLGGLGLLVRFRVDRPAAATEEVTAATS